MKLCYNAVMRHFKKRTIALCLASVITVLGSFAADAYTNNILALQINNSADGFVSVVAVTDKPYTQSILTNKINYNTYSITFPSTNSIVKQMPDITGCKNVEAIHVQTHPTTPERPGYTEVFLRTVRDPSIAAKTVLYMSNSNAGAIPQKNLYGPPANAYAPKRASSYWDTLNYSKTNQKTASKPQKESSAAYERNYAEKPSTVNNDEIRIEDFPINYNDVKTESSKERWLIILGVIIVSALVFFIYFLSKDKMASVVGEQNDFDLNEDENGEKKKQKTKSIRKTVNKLDKKYKNKPMKKDNTASDNISAEENTFEGKEGQAEAGSKEREPIVFDLDRLFNEKNKSQEETETSSDKEEEHDDLADFLLEFSFDNEKHQDEPEKSFFDEELFETTIYSNDIHFSKADKDKLLTLMRNEISDDAIDNIAKFAPTEPKQSNELSKIKRLENIIFDYTAKQDLVFTHDDVDTMKKLMDVELDASFVNDLKINEERTLQVQKELEDNKDKPKRVDEELVLNVKDMLPDLSKELKKQGSKRIESEAKPDVVYYSEGYEVSKLSVSNELADITKALESQNKDDFRPSDNLPIVDNEYEVQTLSIKADLPDLADAMAHPNKYREKKKTVKIDENSLLNSIANVQFKPFYEETSGENNQFSDLEAAEDNSVSIAETENQMSDNNAEENAVTDMNREKSSNNEEAEKLLKIIEEQQSERQKKKAKAEAEAEDINIQKQPEEKMVEEAGIIACKIDTKRYNIIKTTSCDENFNCCLAHDENGYDVIGQLNGGYQILKHYDSLKSENLKMRVNEKNVDGSAQYLIRIGINKFLVNVTQTGMEFVMDLC